MDDILKIVFAVATLGHGLAHLAATFNLGRQVGGTAKDNVITVRTWLLPNPSLRFRFPSLARRLPSHAIEPMWW